MYATNALKKRFSENELILLCSKMIYKYGMSMKSEFFKPVKVKFENGIFTPLEKNSNLEEGEYRIVIKPIKQATGLDALLTELEDKITFDADEVDDFLEKRR